MSAVEDYLKARSACEKVLARIEALRGALDTFGRSLSGTPHTALVQIPQEWLARDEIRELLDKACIAWDTMNNAWARIPPEQRGHVAPPIRRIDPA